MKSAIRNAKKEVIVINYIELLKKDAIRETDSDLKSDLSSIFAADLNKTPPLVITKSIELPKTTLKNMNLNDLKINVEPRNLKTPNLGK